MVVPREYNWSDADADTLAEETKEKDPFTGTPAAVPPSLLSAEDIVAYVERTAMVTPFHATDEKLKNASYEACIGDYAYKYGKDGIERLSLTVDGFLRVPANAIVFVESEVFFRLPRYIAARFNLQITHVHRGLLLGTGPLVDPGFRGRLLIPLHNLTSEDYYLHKDDGFIWIEFTRTTFDETRDNEYGDYPDRKNIADGIRWLHKAAFDKHLNREVPIRSSILPIVERIDGRSRQALMTVRRLERFGTIGALTLVITFGIIMLTEIYSNRNFMQSAYNLWITEGVVPAVEAKGLEGDVNELKDRVSAAEAKSQDVSDGLQRQIELLRLENAELRRRIDGPAGIAPTRPSGSR